MSSREAFEQAVGPHMKGLYAFIRHLNRSDCDDIYQETLLAAWQGIGQLREQESLRSWLYRIARFKAMDALRRSYRREAREEAWPEELPQAGFEALSALRLDLQQAMSTLTRQDRALLYLVYNQGFTFRQAGQAMDIPEGTAKSRAFNLKRRLKALMGEEEET